MNTEQKLEAIKALINGEWDNEQLMKIGPLFVDPLENIKTILEY
jgi:hypothetical protein